MVSQPANNHSTASNLLIISIIVCFIYIASVYIKPFAWASIITISTWPAYQIIRRKAFFGNSTAASLFFTIIIAIGIATPIAIIIIKLINEIHYLITFLNQHKAIGIQEPTGLAKLPLIGTKLDSLWRKYLSEPQALQKINLTLNNFIHTHIPSLFDSIKKISGTILSHSISILFCFVALFFFYRDGDKLAEKTQNVGSKVLADKWNTYFRNLPNSIRAVVNSTVLVGLGVGFIMGILYMLTGVPVPVLFGFITAILSMIPFGVSIAILMASATLLIKAKLIAAVFIIIFGTVLTFLTDSFIKPSLIGNSTELPFLMIFIGILGGIEKFHFLGLFIGPIVMLLLMTLIQEITNKEDATQLKKT